VWRLVAKGGFVEGEANCRSLGFARDDKKGRLDARRERLLRGRVVARAGFGEGERELQIRSATLGMTKRRGFL
jgi:hypothetical protein